MKVYPREQQDLFKLARRSGFHRRKARPFARRAHIMQKDLATFANASIDEAVIEVMDALRAGVAYSKSLGSNK